MLDEIPTAAAQTQSPKNLGQMFILIDVGKLLPVQDGRRRLDRAKDIIAGTSPAQDAAPRLPGERAPDCLRKARDEGLVLRPELLRELTGLAAAPRAS